MTEAETIADLKEQVTYWKGEAQHNVDSELRERIGRALGLTTAESYLLATLYQARGEVVRTARLDEDLPGRKTWDERESSNVVQVMVCRIRRQLGNDAVLTVRGVGYRASDRIVARIEEISK